MKRGDGGGGLGFTLAEMLVVVVLLVLVMALATPLVVARVRGTAFVEAQSRVEAMAMLARADAQRRGEGVRVCVRAGSLIEEAVEVKSGLRAILGNYTAFSSEKNAKNDDSGASFDNSNRVPRLRVLGEMELPEGIDFFDTIEAVREASRAGAADGEREPPGEVVIGVALPDGQFEGAGARFMRGAGGRVVRLEVNRWTGAVTATPVALEEEEKEDEGVEESAPGAAPGAAPPPTAAPGGA